MTVKPRYTSSKLRIHYSFLHSHAMLNVKGNSYIFLGLKITEIKIPWNVVDVIWRLLVRNVKIIHYLASCTLQFWSNLAKLFLCIVVNMTCTISRFQDGGSFQLNPLVTTGRLITSQIRPCKQIELEYQIVILFTTHHTPGQIGCDQSIL